MTGTPKRVADRLDVFVPIVGAERIFRAGPELDDAGRCTFAVGHGPAAVVRPKDRAQTRQCLRAASSSGIALYPISRGRNWGLGSSVPPAGECVLLDLGELDRIVHFDEKLATLTVEPGVTFADAHAFLSERGSRLFVSTIGGSPGGSLVGNALERGDGSGPLGDRFAHVCGLEVLLPTGERLRTGFSRYGEGTLSRLHRWGVGPALDGLFSQSNFGVVTEMTFWLSPLPRSLHHVRFELHDDAGLAGAVEVVRALKLDGTITGPVGVWNDYRVASTQGQFPWELTGGSTPLARPMLERLKVERGWGRARWYGTFPLYAPSPAQGRAHLAHVRERLGPVVDHLAHDEYVGEPTSGAELGPPGMPALSFFQGVPHEASLRSVYFRKRSVPLPPLDPDRDRCGILWLCPTIPLAGDDVRAAAAIAEELMLRHGFEPLLAMVSQTPRAFYFVPLIIYDRDVAGEDARAASCHDELLQRMIQAGYLPNRLGIQSMGAMPPPTDDSKKVLERLKRAFDPAQILAPGRYDV